MFQKTNAVVLRTIKHNDTSLVVDLFSETNGHMALLSPTQARKKAGRQASLFQPLSILEIEATNRPTASLNRIKEARAAYPLQSIPNNPYKIAISLFLAEFLYRALHNEASNPPLYAYLEKSILWLDECKRGFANFHVVFLMRLSQFLGLYPNMDHYHEGDFFDMANACFTRLRPLHPSFLPPDDAKALAALARMSYANMHLFRMNRQQRRQCLDAIQAYYKLHLPNFPEIKSAEVLRELFDA